MNESDLPALTALLQRRLEIIADHAWRERDPSAQLEALKEISERITAWSGQNQGNLDGRLKHYLANSSFEKALAHALERTVES